MNTKLLLLVVLLFLFAEQDAHSQFGFTHELGFITGPVLFQSDYGQRNDFETNTKNSGFGVGITYHLNFANNSRLVYFYDHFKIRNEIDFHKSSFEHYGEWVADDKTTRGADQLRAMSGSTTVIEIGSQLEYYPLSISDFEYSAFKVSPFIGFGVHYVHFSPNVESSLGPLNENVPDKYINAFQTEPGSTWAIVGNIGVRYKLNPVSDLVLDSRWSFYLSDYVDGLNPSFENNGRKQVPENKANDWIFWLNVGYIYYLN